MSLDRGTVSYRVFSIEDWPHGAISGFAADAFPGVHGLAKDPVTGFATHRHLYDRNITEDTGVLAGYPYLQLVKAEKKIPGPLLKTECRIEELALMEAEGRPFLRRQERIDVKKQVTERLLPDMPPSLSSIQFAVDVDDSTVYSSATSESKMDAFMVRVRQAIGVCPYPLTPEVYAERVMDVDDRAFGPMNLTDGVVEEMFGCLRGCEFLTFLMWRAHEGDPVIRFKSGKPDVTLMMEGPYTFCGYDSTDGKVAVDLNEGAMKSSEIHAALKHGKMLSSCKLTMAICDRVWCGRVDGRQFTFNSVRLPKGDAIDFPGRFQERMLSLREFNTAFYAMYRTFIALRGSSKWDAVHGKMRNWVQEGQWA